MTTLLPPERLLMQRVDRAGWRACAESQQIAGARLLALWATQRAAVLCVTAAYLGQGSIVVTELLVGQDGTTYPALDDLFCCAERMQRAAADLVGVRAEAEGSRRWLRHAAWSADEYPLRRDFEPALAPAPTHSDTDYPFVRVEGQGVHEIPVGPVHAGIIEPGHFRFSVVGEKVLRLEERLGFVHKGIERRFQELPLLEGQRLACRVSGDATVAYGWAYCQALEGMLDVDIPVRASALRGLALERERIANHLGDLGALGNDAGFGVGYAQFMRLKEQLLRLNEQVFGRRYLFDFIQPGGVNRDLDEAARGPLKNQCAALSAELTRLREIYDNHAGLQDRFVGCGRITPELARRLGVIGLPGRASGQDLDARRDFPLPPFDRLPVRVCGHREGDVAARVALRFDELAQSLDWCVRQLNDLPAGSVQAPATSIAAACAGVAPGRMSFGLIESWRGPVFLALELGQDGRICRCHPHDPSWQNWPALEHAVIGNIVPDFPLINKSLNLSYSGHDL